MRINAVKPMDQRLIAYGMQSQPRKTNTKLQIDVVNPGLPQVPRAPSYSVTMQGSTDMGTGKAAAAHAKRNLNCSQDTTVLST